MHKKSLGNRLSANPVRISRRGEEEREERRRTQTLKSRPASTSDETHIPRPRFRSSSVEASTTGRKSSLKLPARIQHSQYGLATPQASGTTPYTPRQVGSTVRTLCPSGSGLRGRSQSSERPSNIGSKQTRKDNRPLGEKSFQAEMLSKIDSYLMSISKSDLLNSNGSIKPLTLKMFVEVTAVLVKRLGVKQSITTVNYVEELPKIAKRLWYPGLMNKSWLKTANAMYSWPQVLGWLSWLAETCAAKDLAVEHFQLENLPFIETDVNKSMEFHRIQLEYLFNAYKAWNEEKADEEEALLKAFLRKVEDMQGVSKADVETARTEYEMETAKLEDARTKAQELDEKLKQQEEILKSARLEEARKDAELKELWDEEKSYLAAIGALKEEKKALQETYEWQQIRRKELQAEINSQPMSVAKRDEIVERCGTMQNQMKELDKHLNDLEKEVYMLDIKLASTRNNLNKLVFAYNKEIFLHFDKESGIDLEDIAMPLTGISNPDIMEELERKANLMSDFRENMEKQNTNVESEIEVAKKQLEILDAERIRLESEKEERLARNNENEERMKAQKAAAKAEEAELKLSIEKMKQDIKDMRNKMPDLAQEEKAIAEAKEKIEALIRRKAYLEESARLFFDKMHQIFADQNNRLIRILEDKK